MGDRHTDSDYEQELKYLKERILLMTGRVEEMIEKAIISLVERDRELAQEGIELDEAVDLDEKEIDEHCLLVLAKRQPLASDLRLITLTMKIVTDLERIGDLATNICERSQELALIPSLKPYEDIPLMGSIVQSMIQDVIKAFIDGDDKAARAVIARDDEMDELYHRVFKELVAIMVKNENAVEPGIRIQSVAKYLERIGDHIVNIAEQVVFMVKGKDIRHGGDFNVL